MNTAQRKQTDHYLTSNTGGAKMVAKRNGMAQPSADGPRFHRNEPEQML